MLVDELLDLVPPAQPESELVEQGELAAAGLEAGSDAVVQKGLAFEWSAADPLVAGEDDEPGLANDRQSLVISGARWYEAAGTAGPGDVAADVVQGLGDADAVLVEEPTGCLETGGHAEVRQPG